MELCILKSGVCVMFAVIYRNYVYNIQYVFDIVNLLK